MAKIVISELDIDVNALIKSTAEVKKSIDSLKEQQKELTKQGETSSNQFVQNAADLKTLSSAYNSNLKAIQESTQATADQAVRVDLLNLAVQQEVSSIKEARDQNSLLNKLRNETNVTTAEGRAELKLLNDKLDENNEFIKANADAYLKQKINIGNYTESMKDAISQINPLNGGLSGFISRSQEAGGVGNLLKTSLAGATQGMMGMVQASLAFIATPIGAVIAALVLAFALVKNAMDRSEDSTNKITKVFKIFTGIVQKLLQWLEPLGELLIDGIVKGFELAGKAAEKWLGYAEKFSNFVGLEKVSKSIGTFTNEMKNAAVQAGVLADKEAQLEKAQRASQLTQLEYQKNAEKLRQIRDDENKTIDERIKANEDLGVVLKAQLRDELKIAQLALEVANARIKAEGSTKETLDGQAEALTTIADIQERITGQESEQLVNRVSLQKEARDKAIEYQNKIAEANQKRLDEAVALSQAELDLFLSSQGIKAKSIQEELTLAEQVYQKQLEINQKEFNASEKKAVDRLALQTANNEALNALQQTQTDIVLSNAERELQIYIDANQSRLDANKFLTDELVAQEIDRLNRISEAQAEYETQRLVNGEINQQQYNDAINAIDVEFQLAKDEALLLREQAEIEKKAIDLENERIGREQTLQDQLNQLDLQRQNEIKAAEKSGADVKIIEDKYNRIKADLVMKAELAKVQAYSDTFSQLSGLFKAGSNEAKFFASSAALVDTFLGAQKAYVSQLIPGDPTSVVRAALAAGVATAGGLKNVAAINNVKFEKGGLIPIEGRSHAQGGEPVYIGNQYIGEAEADEGVGILNKKSFGAFMALNNSIPNGISTPTFMQGGGIITQGVQPQQININELANITLQSIRSLPNPVVIVEDINYQQNDYVGVVNGADF